MKARKPDSHWFSANAKQGLTLLVIRSNEEVDGLEEQDRLFEEIVAAYADISRDLPDKSCVVVIEAEVATSQLIRVLYQLYREAQRHDASLYVCRFPEEFMISLSTLGLTELPGFILCETEELGLQRAAKKQKEISGHNG